MMSRCSERAESHQDLRRAAGAAAAMTGVLGRWRVRAFGRRCRAPNWIRYRPRPRRTSWRAPRSPADPDRGEPLGVPRGPRPGPDQRPTSATVTGPGMCRVLRLGPARAGSAADGREGRGTRRAAVRDRRFWFLAGAFVAHSAAMSTMTVHLVGFLVVRSGDRLLLLAAKPLILWDFSPK